MEHERCSELLPAHVAGTLSAPDARAVEDHLADCEQCAEEARAVVVLRTDPAAPMTELERRRLHAGLGFGAKSPGRHVAPWLGVAATIALIAVAAAVWLPQTGGQDEAADTAGRQLESVNDGDSGADADAAAEGGTSDALRSKAAPVEAGLAAEAPEPTYLPEVLDFSTEELGRFGRTAPPFPEYADFYSAPDAAERHDRYARKLTNAAPPEQAPLVQECVDEVASALPYPVLPALAALATVDGERVFLLGFAWTFSPSGPLDRFMLWGWRPGQCGGAPLLYQTGDIKVP